MRLGRRGFLRGAVAGLLTAAVPRGLLGDDRPWQTVMGATFVRCIDKALRHVTADSTITVVDEHGRTAQYEVHVGDYLDLRLGGGEVWVHDADRQFFGRVVAVTRSWPVFS